MAARVWFGLSLALLVSVNVVRAGVPYFPTDEIKLPYVLAAHRFSPENWTAQIIKDEKAKEVTEKPVVIVIPETRTPEKEIAEVEETREATKKPVIVSPGNKTPAKEINKEEETKGVISEEPAKVTPEKKAPTKAT